MVYHCPFCNKTHIKMQLYGYLCKYVNRNNVPDSCLVWIEEKKKTLRFDQPFNKRKDTCRVCDMRGEAVFVYYCFDCKKWFYDEPVVYLNENTKEDDTDEN